MSLVFLAIIIILDYTTFYAQMRRGNSPIFLMSPLVGVFFNKEENKVEGRRKGFFLKNNIS